MNFIDIHNHGAWGIDDGIQNMEDAKELLQQAKEDGITQIISTPHCSPAHCDQESSDIQYKRVQDYKELAYCYGIHVHTGNELLINQAYKELFAGKYFMSMANSDYVLVEFDLRKDVSEIKDVDDWLYEIILMGYRPIIAHAERFYQKKLNIQQIQHWVKMGCFIQINRTSYLGLHGDNNQYNSQLLLDYGLVHIVASDVHRIDGNRVCKLSDVYKKLKRQYGEVNAKLLCHDNPLYIIENKTLQKMVEKPSLLHRWMKG